MNLAVADLFTLNIYGLQGSLVTSLAHGLSSSGLFDYTVLLLALIAAETAMALSLIIGSRGLSGRLSVRNNVSNYSTYLPKCQRLLSGPLGRRHPSGAVHMAPSYICYMDNCFCNE